MLGAGPFFGAQQLRRLLQMTGESDFRSLVRKEYGGVDQRSGIHVVTILG